MSNTINQLLDTVSSSDIEHILHAIRYAQPLPTTALNHLLQINQVIHHGMSRSVRDYTTIRWLTDHISYQWRYCRHHFHLPLIEKNQRQELLDMVAQDFQQGSVELETWSVLYIRHVRMEVSVSLEELEQQLGISARTLRRRQQRGCERLLQVILAS